MPGKAPFASPVEIYRQPAKLQAAETCHLSSALPQSGLPLTSCQNAWCPLSTGSYYPKAQRIKALPQALAEPSSLNSKSML